MGWCARSAEFEKKPKAVETFGTKAMLPLHKVARSYGYSAIPTLL